MIKYLLSTFCSFCLSISLMGQQVPKWGQWTAWGEQPGGTYQNPIIPSDYSDIDCIRVGEDYYAISSTFQFSPGMTLLHSKDLVNWEICTNIVEDLTRIGTELNWNRMNRYARGIWAGTLRYHNGRFYLFFGTPDEGYFMTSASRAEGPWEPLTTLLSESGWDDCTAFGMKTGRLILLVHVLPMATRLICLIWLPMGGASIENRLVFSTRGMGGKPINCSRLMAGIISSLVSINLNSGAT